jgi:hypothetical protein
METPLHFQTLMALIDQGLCRKIAPNDPRFIDDYDYVDGPPDAEVQEICLRCSLRDQCLEYALDTEAPDGESGVWGGTTPYQRRQLKRDLSRVRCPACLSDAVMSAGRGEVCISCGMSWLV